MHEMSALLATSDVSSAGINGLFELASAVMAAGIIGTVTAIVRMRAKLSEVVWTLRDLVKQTAQVEQEGDERNRDHERRIGSLEQGIAGLRSDVLHLAQIREARPRHG